jgi:hypothetical protein
LRRPSPSFSCAERSFMTRTLAFRRWFLAKSLPIWVHSPV